MTSSVFSISRKLHVDFWTHASNATAIIMTIIVKVLGCNHCCHKLESVVSFNCSTALVYTIVEVGGAAAGTMIGYG